MDDIVFVFREPPYFADVKRPAANAGAEPEKRIWAVNGKTRQDEGEVAYVDSQGDVLELSFDAGVCDIELVCPDKVPAFAVATPDGNMAEPAVNADVIQAERIGDAAILYGKVLVVRMQEKEPAAIGEPGVAYRHGGRSPQADGKYSALYELHLNRRRGLRS